MGSALHVRHWAIALLIATWASTSGAQWTLPEAAGAHPDYRGSVPAKSDVVFSSRFERPQAPDVAKSFGASRIEWVYSIDTAFVASLQRAAPWYGGAINANGPLPSEDGYARDFDGQVLVAPWMKAWGGQWYSVASPVTRRVLLERAKSVIDAGGRSLQVDDPLFQLQAVMFHGGDFSEAALSGFRRYLADYPDRAKLRDLGLDDTAVDYRDYLRARHKVRDAKDYKSRFRNFPSTSIWIDYSRRVVADFTLELRGVLRAARPKALALSMNLTSFTEPDGKHKMFFLTDYLDYAMSETYINDAVELASQAATLRALGVGYVPSLVPRSASENRVAIAKLYAMGATPIVPWDTYAGNDSAGKAKRYFGTLEEYGDLYAFVRAQPGLFDRHEPTPVVGILVPIASYKSGPTKNLVALLQQNRIPFAFVTLGMSDGQPRMPAARLKRFKLLVAVNPDSDFAKEDLALLKQAGVQHTMSADLKSEFLDELQPFVVAPGAAEVQLYPTAVPGKTDHIVLHVIDESQGTEQKAARGCQRRIGIRKTVLGGARVSEASWVDKSGIDVLKVDETERAFLMSVDRCVLWGAVRMELQR